MEDLLDSLRTIRQQLGTTQVELAYQSGISLPSIQNMEAGRGNPSIETLHAVAESLGLKLKFSAKSANWDNLAFLGAPLITLSPAIAVADLKSLLGTLKDACVELRYSDQVPDQERKLEALQALILALEGHFPKIFKKYCSSSTLICGLKPTVITGKLIKLRRIAIARLAEYL
jgi:transcriptional regulator with XRE-family HTH domain